MITIGMLAAWFILSSFVFLILSIFLEKQMIAGGFLEKIYESQVAKYAARIKILEIGQVAEKISNAMDDLARGRRNFRKNSNNRKQQQLFTGSDLWQNEGLGDI